MSLAVNSLFSLTHRRRFGIFSGTKFEDSSNLIEKLNSSPEQSHSLSDLDGQTTSPNAIYYSQDDSGLIAVGDEDGNAHIFDTIHNKFLIAWNPHKSAILDLVWVPTVTKIITCSADRRIVVSDAVKTQAELAFLGHSNSIRCLDLSHDHPTTFASGGRDGRVLIWDIRYPRKECSAYHPINSITPFKKESNEYKRQINVTSVKFLSERMLATCADASHLIKIWDTRRTYTNYKRIPLPWHTLCPRFALSLNRGYTCLTADQSCANIYASGLNGYIRRFSTNFNSNSELDNYYGHRGNSFYIRSCLSPNGHWLLSGSLCGKAYMWDVTKPGSHQYTLGCDTSGEILAVAWSPVNVDNVTICSDEGITFWNMKVNPEQNTSKYYQICKSEEKMEGLGDVDIRKSKRLKISTLDSFVLTSQPDSLEKKDTLEKSTTEPSGIYSNKEVKTERIEDLNETATTVSITESMNKLAVETASAADVPTDSVTVSTEKQRSISEFIFSGKGVKRKRSIDAMDV